MLFCFKVIVDLEGTILCKKSIFFQAKSPTTIFICIPPPPHSRPPKCWISKTRKVRELYTKSPQLAVLSKESTAFDTLSFQ